MLYSLPDEFLTGSISPARMLIVPLGDKCLRMPELRKIAKRYKTTVCDNGLRIRVER